MPSISISGSPTATRSTGLVSFSRSGLPREPGPDPVCLPRGHRRQGSGAGAAPDDSFGFGLARTQFSNSFLPLLRQQFNLGLQREDAIEMYYNMAITPWMNVTSDLQIIYSGLNRALSPTTGQLTGIDTVVVARARFRVRF